MKKLLLSSIIMFGVCGFVTAQNATDAKLKKAAPATNSISPAPQKAAVATGTDLTPASDNIDGTKQTSVKTVEGVKVAPPTSADVAGVPTESDIAKKKAAQAQAAPAPPVKKSKQQN